MDRPCIPADQSRDKIIVRTSIIGIITNILLSGFKAAIGLISNSIAVVLDAVNNLSDALSSVIIIIGTKLSSRKPDKKHPLGHGRIEYLSSLIVSGIVLYAGITALVESIKKIIHPEESNYSVVSLIIIATAVVVKFILGTFVKAQGKKAGSSALVASGSDAFFDAILSASVLLSAIIFLTTGVSLEAYVGIVIAVFIIKAGIEMMVDTLNDILGRRADPEMVHKIKDVILREPDIRGAYDLFINNYGPDKNYATVHIELPDTMTVSEVDKLTRKLQVAVHKETGVILTGVGVYSYNTGDDEISKMRNAIQRKVMSHNYVLQFHGFYVDEDTKSVRFDVVLSFDVDHHEAIKEIYSEIKDMYPDYEFYVTPDVDISD